MIVPAAAAAAAAAGTVDSTAWRDICVKMSDNTTTFHSTPCSFSGWEREGGERERGRRESGKEE